MTPPAEATHRSLDVPLGDLRCRGAVWVIERLHEAGHEAYLVGGCVRDLLLGREPKDYDIATGALPEEVQRLFPQTVAVGRAFGVIMVIHGGLEYDVATFRKDVDYSDGRRPESVAFCSAREDVLRRDFTINGLLYQHELKQVVDYVGGLQDLDAGIVRAIGDPLVRFEEDHLRVLRALRFSLQLRFHLEGGTHAAVVESASKLVRISRERIRDEFVKMLSLEWFGEYLQDIRESGVFPYLLPGWYSRVAEDGVWGHVAARFSGFSSLGLAASPGLYLALLLMPWVEEAVAGARFVKGLDEDLKGLKLSRSQEKWVREALEVACRVRRARGQMSRSSLIRLGRLDASREGLGMALLESRVTEAEYQEDVDALARHAAQLGNADLYPEALLSGDDLIAEGISAGPLLGVLLREIEDAQLEGLLSDRAEALRFALDSAASKGQ